MKVQRTISLDERTADVAGSIENLSMWVRARLMEWDEAGRPEGATKEEVDRIIRRGSERQLAAALFSRMEQGSPLAEALLDFLGALR